MTSRHPGEPNDRLPTADEVRALSPGADLLTLLLDALTSQALGRPLRPRLKLTPGGLVRGQVDVVELELPAFSVAGLVVDRFALRAERLRVVPGIPPRLVAEPARFRTVVSQANVDRWVRSSRLPVRLSLTDEGIVTTTGLAGVRVSETLTELRASGRLLRLRPIRASMLGVPTPMVRLLRGYLPLPPLPREAVLESVETTDGELVASFRIDRWERPLTPALNTRLRSFLPLPGRSVPD